MINAAQAALGISGIGEIGRSISGQGRSGFEGINLKLDQLIEMQNKGGGAMPVEQPPVLPPGNLGGNLAQPDPVMPEIQNAGGGGLGPSFGMDPIGGGMDPIADATVNEPYQMPQSRSFI
jgi:hypothetical protein|tara:strand:+ start:40 stop:399 length:360 start_codon:yes stop_codon:yes gene_type:complete